ncbi:MAG TPA: hypothetical protein VMY59_01065 [Candidatus Thermoplasmatota archaeon]|nr:hypothetical protein [Candidatus Thermoplasmatota archaeon]
MKWIKNNIKKLTKNMNMRWMNEKNIDELKRQRKILHTLALMQMILLFGFLTIFLVTWCFTVDVLFPFMTAILTILFTVLYGVYIIKRDLCTVMIFLKEATLTEVEP